MVGPGPLPIAPNRDVTPQVIADELCKRIDVSEDEGQFFREAFKDTGVDTKHGLTELFYLRSIAVDYGLFMALEGSERDAILQAYEHRQGQLVDETYSSDEFLLRQLAYHEALREVVKRQEFKLEEGRQVKESNAFRAVGFKFAEFCGSHDVLLSGLGERVFGSFLWITYNFMKRVKPLVFPATVSPAEGSTQYRGDYGNLFVTPSVEAAEIFSSMTREEKVNFTDLLGRLQEWHEGVVERGPLSFHPKARASLWGAALGKIADHYHETGQNDRALFFATAAWNISKYPSFAYNAGVLASEEGESARGKQFLQTYLDEYPEVLTNPILRLVEPTVTADELEHRAEAARAKLAKL